MFQIHKPTDGGVTTIEGGLLPVWAVPNWHDRFPDVASDTNTLVVAGEGGKIARSTDFGLTWQEIASPLNGFAGMPRFAGDKHAWTFAGRTLIHTTDGGLSWTVQPTSNSADITSLVAVDAEHAFFVARGVYPTSDGGATWAALPYASDGQVADLAGTPGGKLYAAGDTFGSGDGGLTWNEFGMESTRVDAVGEDHLWALDQRELNRSVDAGTTWITSTVPSALTAMDFADAHRGWATSWGAIYRSDDGGATWRELPRGAGCHCDDAGFLDVFFLDAERGWILAEESNFTGGRSWFVMTTGDGGATWERLGPPTLGGTSLGYGGRLKFLSATEGWFAGYATGDPESAPLLFHTTDGGRTWCLAYAPGHNGELLHDVDFAGAAGWAVGDNGLVLRTTDGGATWTESHYPPAANLLSVQAMGPDRVFIGSDAGLVLRWDAPRLYLPLLVR